MLAPGQAADERGNSPALTKGIMRFNRLATVAVAAVLMTPIPAAAQTDGWRTIIYPVHG